MDNPLTVGQDLIIGLHHAVRGQATVFFAQGHGAPGGRKTHAQLLGRLELGAHEVARHLGGVDIVVVRGRGAAGFEQLAHGQQRRIVHRLLIQVLPDFIEIDQPVEKFGILYRRQVAGQGLVEVVVGIDETGHHHTVGAVDGSIGVHGQAGADFGNAVVLNQNIFILP